MINLIPNEEKKTRVRDFYFRLVVVLFFVLSTALLIGTVSLLPAYFLSVIRENVAADKLAQQVSEPEPAVDPQTGAIIKDLDTKLKLVENSEKNKYLLSDKIINEIVIGKMHDIKITDISYKNAPLTGRTVSVRGVAPSRERLLLFRRSLEDNIAFKKVDLPISNFVQGTNISFNLNLVPS